MKRIIYLVLAVLMITSHGARGDCTSEMSATPERMQAVAEFLSTLPNEDAGNTDIKVVTITYGNFVYSASLKDQTILFERKSDGLQKRFFDTDMDGQVDIARSSDESKNFSGPKTWFGLTGKENEEYWQDEMDAAVDNILLRACESEYVSN